MTEQDAMNTTDHAVLVQSVSHRHGQTLALDAVSLQLPRGATVGLIGPDGVGKSTLLSLIAGVRVIQQGSILVLGQDIARAQVRQVLSHHIAFMPQGLGRNLYPTLSVQENIDFHARLFGLSAQERRQRIQRLLDATGLAPFPDRPAGKLSGGMKQKLSLCCALVHSPELLILDEPTTGVDPLSRRQFWSLVGELRAENPGMTLIVATAYIEEAGQFEHLLAMDDGRLLVNRPTRAVLDELGADTLEAAYIRLLPPEKRQGAGELELTPFVADPDAPPAIEAHGLTRRFGSFTAVDRVSFRIGQGEIFGFLGSNGCGKSTTMKMLTGLLDATEGSAELLGQPVAAGGMQTRMRVGYMSQAFSLYEELSVRQNLVLHARLYRLQGADGDEAVARSLRQFDLDRHADALPAALPLGIRQRLQLAAACLHRPEVLILDEPTSGVDPAARDMFWRHLLQLSRQQRITIFISTHFMNEAERCDRISFMHRGRVLAVGTPAELVRQYRAASLEDAFIQYLLDDEQAQHDASTPVVPTTAATATVAATAAARPTTATATATTTTARVMTAATARTESPTDPQTGRTPTQPGATTTGPAPVPPTRATPGSRPQARGLRHWLATMLTFALRESRELLRDRIRLFFALAGPMILLATVGWSISFDVNDLPFAVLDRDQSAESRQLIEHFSGSAYFVARTPLTSADQITTVLKGARTKLVIDIPPGFGRDLQALRRPEVAFHIDGVPPFNASNIRAYVGGILAGYGRELARGSGLATPGPAAIVEARFRYNQDFRSINAVTPNVMMTALMLIPAMMTALGVVREREIGSIANLHASPASVAQYLIGKQLPYILTGLVNYLLLVLMIVLWFGVPVKGSFWAMSLGTLLLVTASTGLGLLVSSLVRSQSAALFTTAIITLIPTINYSGLLYPMSSMSGAAYYIGTLFPASWYQRISIGAFTKGLGASSFVQEYLMLILFALCFISLSCRFLKKQET